MNVITVSEPQTAQQTSLICKRLDAKLKSIGSQLENLKSLLNRVSFIVARHKFDRLTALENRYLYLRHDISTYLMLKDFGLYESVRVSSPYHEHRINLEAQHLEVHLIQFRNVLFTKNKVNSML